MENFCAQLTTNKKLIILLIGIFLLIELSISSQHLEGSVKPRVECKVVPLKVRSDIKADTIFSGTVLSFYIKQPHRFLKHGKTYREIRIPDKSSIKIAKNQLEAS